MDVPEAETAVNVDKVFLHFMYGFLVLLGFSIVISLGRAIYHFYKLRREQIVEPVNDTMDTECHSVLIGPPVLDRPSENNETDSERLRLQLDKLRRLLNRLNAMGTFSRDTIGDLSAESAVRVNHSKAASSDMSEFWSSIDFDEFDDSTINYGKFGKTPTEKSVSPSISDFSLDTSGIPFDNGRHKNFATSSRENVLNVSSALNRHTNPSDAIIQILTILDSIMLKNKNCGLPLKNDNLDIDKTSYESKAHYLPKELYASKSSIPTQKLNLSPYVSKNKKFYTHESLNSNSVNNMPDDKNSKTSNSNAKQGSVFSSNTKLIEQLPCKKRFANPIDGKISKVMSVINITSSSNSKKNYADKLSSSTESLGNKISISQSVSLCVDPFTCLSAHPKELSKSVSAAPGGSICKEVESNTVSELSPSALGIEAINRSHSLSDLLDKTLLSIESNIEKSCSYEKDAGVLNLIPENKSEIVKIYPESSADYQIPFPKTNGMFDKGDTKSKSTLEINHKIISSISPKSFHSAFNLNSLTLKPTVNRTEMKRSQILTMPSPNLSSGSDAFLSPLVIDISPSDKIEWKSPVEINSDTVVRNLTPHSQNAVLTRKSFIWSTPPLPLPKESVSDEIVI